MQNLWQVKHKESSREKSGEKWNVFFVTGLLCFALLVTLFGSANEQNVRMNVFV